MPETGSQLTASSSSQAGFCAALPSPVGDSRVESRRSHLGGRFYRETAVAESVTALDFYRKLWDIGRAKVRVDDNISARLRGAT
jgi:hypothetical protein